MFVRGVFVAGSWWCSGSGGDVAVPGAAGVADLAVGGGVVEAECGGGDRGGDVEHELAEGGGPGAAQGDAERAQVGW